MLIYKANSINKKNNKIQSVLIIDVAVHRLCGKELKKNKNKLINFAISCVITYMDVPILEIVFLD